MTKPNKKVKNSRLENFTSTFKKLDDHKKASVIYVLKRSQKHKMHIVAPSPWPIFSACSALIFVLGFIFWMHGEGSVVLLCGIITILCSFYFWYQDIIREGLYMGYHTSIVEQCLRTGFVLFLVSEVMFFFGFFWALLHFSLVTEPILGNIWPPEGIVHHLFSENILFSPNEENKELPLWISMLNPQLHAGSEWLNSNYEEVAYFDSLIEWSIVYKESDPAYERGVSDLFLLKETPRSPRNFSSKYFLDYFYFYNKVFSRLDIAEAPVFHITVRSAGVLINPYSLPLLNTLILVTSGAVLTLAHYAIKQEEFKKAFYFLNGTVALGLCFFLVQLFEYAVSGFSLNDSVYGSIFFLLTGFHGFHVIVGTVFLIVVTVRVWLSHFTANNHFAFEAAAWYWHFVDVVWILLYFLLYLWPSKRYFDPTTLTMHVTPHLFSEDFTKFQPGKVEIYLDVQLCETWFYQLYQLNKLPYYGTFVDKDRLFPASKALYVWNNIKPYSFNLHEYTSMGKGVLGVWSAAYALKLTLIEELIDKYDLVNRLCRTLDHDALHYPYGQRCPTCFKENNLLKAGLCHIIERDRVQYFFLENISFDPSSELGKADLALGEKQAAAQARSRMCGAGGCL